MITHEWWDNDREDYTLFISEVVLEEAQQGHPEAVEQRISLLNELSLIKVSSEAEAFAELLLRRQAVAKKSTQDAAHIAVVSVNNIDYLLTWNCKHIANAHKRYQIEQLCIEQGYKPPTICTPEELLGEH